MYSKVADLDNLQLAFWKAQRGKSGKQEVELFRNNLTSNLLQMRFSLLQEDIAIGNYHYFTIYDPKKRTICAASFPERVLHHAIMNVCEPYFEQFQIYDSFACRKGKGLDACLKRTLYFCKKYQFFLKLDIHHFFDTISHDILNALLTRRFKDSQLLNLFARLIASYECLTGRGIPIGNLTSQFFANHYLAFIDHFVKEELKAPGYVRYMDDFIIFSDMPDKLQYFLGVIEEFLLQKLSLSLNQPLSNRTRHGVAFLGYKVSTRGLRLTQKSKQRFRIKMRRAMQSQSSEHALPLLDFIKRADSFGFRRQYFYGT